MAVVAAPGTVLVAAIAVERRIMGRRHPWNHQAEQSREEDQYQSHGAIKPQTSGKFQGWGVDVIEFLGPVVAG